MTNDEIKKPDDSTSEVKKTSEAHLQRLGIDNKQDQHRFNHATKNWRVSRRESATHDILTDEQIAEIRAKGLGQKLEITDDKPVAKVPAATDAVEEVPKAQQPKPVYASGESYMEGLKVVRNNTPKEQLEQKEQKYNDFYLARKEAEWHAHKQQAENSEQSSDGPLLQATVFKQQEVSLAEISRVLNFGVQNWAVTHGVEIPDAVKDRVETVVHFAEYLAGVGKGAADLCVMEPIKLVVAMHNFNERINDVFSGSEDQRALAALSLAFDTMRAVKPVGDSLATAGQYWFQKIPEGQTSLSDDVIQAASMFSEYWKQLSYEQKGEFFSKNIAPWCIPAGGMIEGFEASRFAAGLNASGNAGVLDEVLSIAQNFAKQPELATAPQLDDGVLYATRYLEEGGRRPLTSGELSKKLDIPKKEIEALTQEELAQAGIKTFEEKGFFVASEGKTYDQSQLAKHLKKTWEEIASMTLEELQAEGITAIEPVNGKMPINWKFAGQRCSIDTDVLKQLIQDLPQFKDELISGVYFKDSGYPDFSPFVYVTEDGAKAQKWITLTGDRDKDFAAANSLMGWKKEPKGWTWHHNEEAGFMQLIPSELHSEVKHTGGCATSGLDYKLRMIDK